MASLVMLSAVVLLGLLLPSSTADNVLYVGDTLSAGQSLTEGAYTFVMQSDCNLVLYDSGRAVWASGTSGRGSNCFLRLLPIASIVIFGDDGTPIWASETIGSRGKAVLVLQRDGNVVIYGCFAWATGTNTADSDTGSFTPKVVVPAAKELANRKIVTVTNN